MHALTGWLSALLSGRKRKYRTSWATRSSGRTCMYKKTENRLTAHHNCVYNKIFCDFRVYLGEMERVDFQEDLVKRSVCSDSVVCYKAHSGIRGIIETRGWMSAHTPKRLSCSPMLCCWRLATMEIESCITKCRSCPFPIPSFCKHRACSSHFK